MNSTIPVYPKPITDISIVKNVDLDRVTLFNAMANVSEYNLIFPQNVISVNISNQTNDTIYANETLQESYIRTTLYAKHTFHPYDLQTIEILGGDAKGTIIKNSFEDYGNTTKLTTTINLNLQGKLFLIKYLPKSEFENHISNMLNSLVDYTKGYNDEYKNKVDKLYREILSRPADKKGLEFYSSQLKNKEMTVDDVKNALLNSDERRNILLPSEYKTQDELKTETKQTVEDLYQQILGRPADQQGLEYYGSLLESNKVTKDKLARILSNSDEAINNRLSNPTKRLIDDLYIQFFNKHADQQTIDHYFQLLQTKKITWDELKNEFALEKQNGK